jgi:hypothetical protein
VERLFSNYLADPGLAAEASAGTRAEIQGVGIGLPSSGQSLHVRVSVSYTRCTHDAMRVANALSLGFTSAVSNEEGHGKDEYLTRSGRGDKFFL